MDAMQQQIESKWVLAKLLRMGRPRRGTSRLQQRIETDSARRHAQLRHRQYPQQQQHQQSDQWLPDSKRQRRPLQEKPRHLRQQHRKHHPNKQQQAERQPGSPHQQQDARQPQQSRLQQGRQPKLLDRPQHYDQPRRERGRQCWQWEEWQQQPQQAEQRQQEAKQQWEEPGDGQQETTGTGRSTQQQSTCRRHLLTTKAWQRRSKQQPAMLRPQESRRPPETRPQDKQQQQQKEEMRKQQQQQAQGAFCQLEKEQGQAKQHKTGTNVVGKEVWSDWQATERQQTYSERSSAPVLQVKRTAFVRKKLVAGLATVCLIYLFSSDRQLPPVPLYRNQQQRQPQSWELHQRQQPQHHHQRERQLQVQQEQQAKQVQQPLWQGCWRQVQQQQQQKWKTESEQRLHEDLSSQLLKRTVSAGRFRLTTLLDLFGIEGAYCFEQKGEEARKQPQQQPAGRQAKTIVYMWLIQGQLQQHVEQRRIALLQHHQQEMRHLRDMRGRSSGADGVTAITDYLSLSTGEFTSSDSGRLSNKNSDRGNSSNSIIRRTGYSSVIESEEKLHDDEEGRSADARGQEVRRNSDADLSRRGTPNGGKATEATTTARHARAAGREPTSGKRNWTERDVAAAARAAASARGAPAAKKAAGGGTGAPAAASDTAAGSKAETPLLEKGATRRAATDSSSAKYPAATVAAATERRLQGIPPDWEAGAEPVKDAVTKPVAKGSASAERETQAEENKVAKYDESTDVGTTGETEVTGDQTLVDTATAVTSSSAETVAAGRQCSEERLRQQRRSRLQVPWREAADMQATWGRRSPKRTGEQAAGGGEASEGAAVDHASSNRIGEKCLLDKDAPSDTDLRERSADAWRKFREIRALGGASLRKT